MSTLDNTTGPTFYACGCSIAESAFLACLTLQVYGRYHVPAHVAAASPAYLQGQLAALHESRLHHQELFLMCKYSFSQYLQHDVNLDIQHPSAHMAQRARMVVDADDEEATEDAEIANDQEGDRSIDDDNLGMGDEVATQLSVLGL